MPIDVGQSVAGLAGGLKVPKLGGVKALGGTQGMTVAQTKRFLSEAYAFLLALGTTNDFAAFDLGAAIQQRIDELDKTTDVRMSRIDRVTRLSALIVQVAQQAGSFDQTEFGADKLADMSKTFTGVAGVGAGVGDAFSKVQSVVGKAPMAGELDGMLSDGVPGVDDFELPEDLEL